MCGRRVNGVDATNARRDGHVLDALAATGLEPVLIDIRALAEAVLGDGEDAECALFVLFGCDGRADDRSRSCEAIPRTP